MKRVAIDPAFESWRDAARALLAADMPPSEVLWDDGTTERLLDGFATTWSGPPVRRGVALPRKFVDLATRVAAHRDPERWDHLYRVAFRLLHENRNLLDVIVDDDVQRLAELDHDIRRDVHKMHAFVRFRVVDDRYVAWYRPDHRIVPLAAPFFVERFRSMEWSILTPEKSAHWAGGTLTFGPGVSRASAPAPDDLEEMWRAYYAAVFNPARTNLQKMRAEVPSRFWRDLPELRDVPKLLGNASSSVGSMFVEQQQAPTAAPFVPATSSVDALREAARSCAGCDLHGRATQTVFGEGPLDARVVFIGEQPGDREDLDGRPFVGPAGAVLDDAFAAAGIDRRKVYLTNAVKHFAYIERGKARIHRTPRTIEVAACRPWLDAEIRLIDPHLIVCLGATAAQTLLGARFRVTRDRGQFLRTRDAREIFATIHPSAVLRVDPALRQQYFDGLVGDLKKVADRLR